MKQTNTKGFMMKQTNKQTNYPMDQESVAGSVIQATGTVEFEDGLWIGNHLKARNGLQRVRTIPGFDQGRCAHLGSFRGRLNSNLPGSAWLLGDEPGGGFESRQLRC